MGCTPSRPTSTDAAFIQDLDSILQPTIAPFDEYDELLRSVESGAVAPLRGSWLLALYEAGGRLKRRQELPDRAFWTAAELRSIVDAARQHFGLGTEAAKDALGHLFNALSYRWLAKGQPDPHGFHLERVANFLYSYLGWGNPKYKAFEKYKDNYLDATPLNKHLFKPLGLETPPDCAVFWDYGVLWQKALPGPDGTQEDDRSELQRAQMGKGLKWSNVWYGHAHALTWVQPELPDGFEGASYEQSGWCFVEASLSSVLKSSQKRINIGKFTSGRDGEGFFFPNVPYAIKQSAIGSRPPVRAPNKVAAMLEGKTFFARADVATVAALYCDFFEAVAPWRRSLKLHGLGWGDEEVAETCSALASFSRLATLDLSGNRIGVDGAKRVAGLCEVSASVTSLSLGDNNLGDDGIEALSIGLKESKSLATLDLSNRYGSSTKFGPKGAAALASAIAVMASLTSVS